MKTSEIRRSFLKYFADREHAIVPSSSLVPAGDKTLLFTNAGMVQFKNVFLGEEKRSYVCAASAQRCVRAGGKHNDLDNVGYTARHHTFFEMLGNFSFGAYFKREAIQYAWEYLTEILKLPKEKLWITVFEEDEEAANIWLKEIKIDPTQFSRCGEKDNFWAMGDTGPCGPCSEIFYDHGPEIAGGPPGTPEADGDRYVEIWNLVFMQFNRDHSGKMTQLPQPSVDTGMGLERIAAVMQGVHNNYDIDLFQNIITAIRVLLAQTIPSKTYSETDLYSLRVVADHLRSTSFLIVDEVVPSNEGRGYVLRRIIRRAIRHGHKLGFQEAFLYKLVKALVIEMAEAYPNLAKNQEHIERVLQREEELFAHTLEQGMKLFQQTLTNLSGSIIPGDVVFKLYDTYGFPMDLTADIAREKNYCIDEIGFHQKMEQQRLRSQASSRFGEEGEQHLQLEAPTTFIGYQHLQGESKIVAIIQGNETVSTLSAGQEAALVLEHSPFYGEAGGQIGDSGVIRTTEALFEVHDTRSSKDSLLHIGKLLKGELKVQETIIAEVDDQKRKAIAANHSATHLLNAALRQILGEHVLQKGSLVEVERLRFDFSHFEPISKDHLYLIEDCVNQAVRSNFLVETQLMTPEEAMDKGAMALFGEKYGAEVRVLKMGDFSMELCGGTHVQRTGDIGLFKIISETGIAAGIRRIEALTGHFALASIRHQEQQVQQLALLLKAEPKNMKEKVEQLLRLSKSQEKELEKLQSKVAAKQSQDLLTERKSIQGISFLAKHLELTSTQQLRELLDQLKARSPHTIFLLTATTEQKITFVTGVTKDLLDKFNAGKLAQYIADQLGGKGGGRADMAQGGGDRIDCIPTALSSVEIWIKECLSNNT